MGDELGLGPITFRLYRSGSCDRATGIIAGFKRFKPRLAALEELQSEKAVWNLEGWPGDVVEGEDA